MQINKCNSAQNSNLGFSAAKIEINRNLIGEKLADIVLKGLESNKKIELSSTRNDIYLIDGIVPKRKGTRRKLLNLKLKIEETVAKFLQQPPYNATIQLDVNSSVERLDKIESIAKCANKIR